MKALARKIKKFWRLFFYFRRIRLMIRMAYSVNFFIMVFGSFLQMILSVVFVRVIFGFIGDLAGWGYYQALAVVATYMIVEGLMWFLCAYLGILETFIKQGSLDGILVKPMDTQFLVSIWRGDPEDAVRLVSGIAVLFYSLSHLGLTWEQLLLNGFFYLLLLANAFFIAYSLTLIFRSVTFWTLEGGSFFALNDVLSKMSQYPTDIIFHAVVRTILTAVIPLAFMATIPAKILVYGLNWQLIGSSFLIAAIFLFVSRRFWLFALNHYSSASN